MLRISVQGKGKEVPITQVLWDFFQVTLSSVLFVLQCTVGKIVLCIHMVKIHFNSRNKIEQD